MACRQRNYLITPAVEDWIGADQDRSSPKSGKGRERGMSAAAKKQDFGTSHWQLADKLLVHVNSLHRYPYCRKG